ncbi:C-terminal domain superfamily [Hexamita inflata]|uniref:C-terminal domain superfamily n=1 Tax=Hexamita inflata TaxID=28002 RepID=A0AA86QG91_9EUKA|nr:C-terminal domain superfamily [Hexamita inflata]
MFPEYLVQLNDILNKQQYLGGQTPSTHDFDAYQELQLENIPDNLKHLNNWAARMKNTRAPQQAAFIFNDCEINMSQELSRQRQAQKRAEQTIMNNSDKLFTDEKGGAGMRHGGMDRMDRMRNMDYDMDMMDRRQHRRQPEARQPEPKPYNRGFVPNEMSKGWQNNLKGMFGKK